MVCGDGGRDLFDLLAELGAGGAEVELDLVVERARGAGIEDVDGLDVEVILEDVLETPCGLEADVVGRAENHFAQRLADFEFLGFAGREGESGEGLDGVHLVEEKHVDFGVIGLGVAFEVDGLPGVVARASDEVLVHRFGEERQDRGDEPGEDFEAFKEGFKGGAGLDGVVLFDFPEPFPVVPDVPVGEVFDEFFDSQRGLPDIDGLKPGATFLDEKLQFGEDPLVEEGAVGKRCGDLPRRPVFEPGVVCEEGVGVPEGVDKTAADLAQGAVAEVEIDLRILARVEPAHGVGAGLFGGVVKPDGVSGRLVHLLAVFVADEGVSEERLERLCVLHHGGHGEEAVEPVSELSGEAFQDEVGGHPLFPVVAVGVVFDGAVGNDARVEPRVSDVLDAVHFSAAVRALQHDLVDPGFVRGVSLKRVPSLNAARLEFVAAADDVEFLAVVADPDGEGESPETFF